MPDASPPVLRVGTCGWSYPKGRGTWDGVFYPPGVGDRDKLAFYAQYFRTVEINSSFYRPPNAEAARGWAAKVPDDFRFTAKLWQKFTHPKMFHDATGQQAELSQDDFHQFVAGLGPLADAGKLGAVIAQFPASFKRDEPALEYLANLVQRFTGVGFPLAIELRHRDWTQPGTAEPVRELFHEHDVAWVMIDEPHFKDSIRHIPWTSSHLGYFRFHGRNYQEWWSHAEAEDRYNYLYPASEQHQLADEVREVTRQAAETYVFYNNHYGAKAVVNAVQLEMALGQPSRATPLPATLLARYPDVAASL